VGKSFDLVRVCTHTADGPHGPKPGYLSTVCIDSREIPSHGSRLHSFFQFESTKQLLIRIQNYIYITCTLETIRIAVVDDFPGNSDRYRCRSVVIQIPSGAHNVQLSCGHKRRFIYTSVPKRRSCDTRDRYSVTNRL